MFKNVLVANRGEIAVRVIRACRELGIKTTAVFSQADSDSLFVRMAHQAVCIGPPHSSVSYLDMRNIVSAAQISGVDAIHPGYGFLSENAEFARLCQEQELIFIGPPPEVIEKMGAKSCARETAVMAGIPVVPGSPGLLTSIEQALELAQEIGYPVLVKASAGGGGRGMRVASGPGELPDAYMAAGAEAKASFGDGSLYLEKYLEQPRHIEFQILADNYGNVVHLGERDCSIQRRNQKVIEEAPSSAVSSELRGVMGDAAVRLAKSVNYRGAGTIEFLLDKYGNFYFMEMNTRIQVEHPVTEMVTGIDLVKEQIRLAAGEPLGYGQEDIVIKGWAIECRINAEDPLRNFLPSPGLLKSYHPPGGPGVRVDSAAFAGWEITPHYDSMIGKLITWGDNRQEAIGRMNRALREFIIEGVYTTLPFYRKVLKNEVFLRGEMCTDFIPRHMGT